MTLVIILNVVLCTAVIVGVVAPLLWAITTRRSSWPPTAAVVRCRPGVLIAVRPPTVVAAGACTSRSSGRCASAV